jgi:phage terminase small subunit
MLKHPAVAAAVAEAKARKAKNSKIREDKVIRELALLAFSDVMHYVIDDDGNVTTTADAPKGATRAISSIKRVVRSDKDGGVTTSVELKLWDKPGPLKLAGRHIGIFPDRVEHVGKDGGPIRIENQIPRTSEDERREIEALEAKARARMGEIPDADAEKAPPTE